MYPEIKVPLAAEGLTKKEIRRAIRQLKSGKHTMGYEVKLFEESFAQYHQMKHAIMVNSGSSANLLALEAICRSTKHQRPKHGSLIAIPAVLWPTTFWPIIQLGFVPIIVDTKKDSLCVDFQQLVLAKKEYGEALVGAILIHPLGKSLDRHSIQEIVDLGIFVIEDTCESLGALNCGRLAGTTGIISTFSFYYSHHITTIEGGMLLTNNDDIANDLRSMRAHGWTRNRDDKHFWDDQFEMAHDDFKFVSSGYNFRPTEINGVLGQSQLEKIEYFLQKRIEFAQEVHEVLQENRNLRLIDYASSQDSNSRNSWMAFPLQIKSDGISLQHVLQEMEKGGIATRPLLAGNFIKQPAVNLEKIIVFGKCENSLNLYRSSFMVGNHHSFSSRQRKQLLSVLSKI